MNRQSDQKIKYKYFDEINIIITSNHLSEKHIAKILAIPQNHVRMLLGGMFVYYSTSDLSLYLRKLKDSVNNAIAAQ